MLENITSAGVKGRWTMSVVFAIGFLISNRYCNNYQVTGVKHIAAIAPFIFGVAFSGLQAQKKTWALLGLAGKQEAPGGSIEKIKNAEKAEGIRKQSKDIFQKASAITIVLTTLVYNKVYAMF